MEEDAAAVGLGTLTWCVVYVCLCEGWLACWLMYEVENECSFELRKNQLFPTISLQTPHSPNDIESASARQSPTTHLAYPPLKWHIRWINPRNSSHSQYLFPFEVLLFWGAISIVWICFPIQSNSSFLRVLRMFPALLCFASSKMEWVSFQSLIYKQTIHSILNFPNEKDNRRIILLFNPRATPWGWLTLILMAFRFGKGFPAEVNN